MDMQIKPQLNLNWYKNTDVYSDGDVEDDIIRYIMENEPEDYGQTIMEHYNWPIYYHLSHTRRNLLNWYPFRQDASVLEIGCGMGAVTGLLCDRCRKVTAVELSKRRATAAQLRCREKENLQIIVGNLNDIEFKEKFDYITLIGVLEYQGTYTNSSHPYRDFLVKIKSLLKDDGKLLLAIENKYGVKYWCGAPEDHTGIPFDGINQYRLSGGEVCTFSKEELRELLEESGFAHSFFYFPMPDYKLPTVVYSEKYMPRNKTLENMVPYYIPSDQTLLIEEEGLYKDIIKNNVFDFFANSFLVECSGKEIGGEKAVFALLNSKRQKEYRVGTVIKDSEQVVKIALEASPFIQNHLAKIQENTEKMEGRGLKVLPYELRNGELKTVYMKASTFADLLCQAVAKGDRSLFLQLCDRLLDQIEMASDEVEQQDCIIYELGIDVYRSDKNYGKILREGYLDMIPRNCFIKGEELWWFDQEWTLDNVPSKFILFRGLLEMYSAFPEIQEFFPLEKVFLNYGMETYINTFVMLNQLFMSMVMDKDYAGIFAEQRDQGVCKKNIMKLL